MVAAVNTVVARSRLGLTRAVGAILIDELFGGEPASFRARGGKHASFRALARHPRMAMSSAALWRAAAIEAQCRELPADVAAELTLAQHRALLPMADSPDKHKVARLAVECCWTGTQLEDAVRDGTVRRGGGRPRIPDGVRAIRALGDAVAAVESHSGGDLRALDALIGRLVAVRMRVAEVTEKRTAP